MSAELEIYSGSILTENEKNSWIWILINTLMPIKQIGKI